MSGIAEYIQGRMTSLWEPDIVCQNPWPTATSIHWKLSADGQYLHTLIRLTWADEQALEIKKTTTYGNLTISWPYRFRDGDEYNEARDHELTGFQEWLRDNTSLACRRDVETRRRELRDRGTVSEF